MAGPSWIRLRGGYLPWKDQRTGVVGAREVWGCSDFPKTGVTYDTSWAAVEGTVPRSLGSNHPDSDISAAVCISKRRVYGPIMGSCKVVVEYSSDLRFGGATRPGVSVGKGLPKMTTLPILGVSADGRNDLISDPSIVPVYRRPVLVRTYETLADGSVDSLAYQIASGCWGKLYTFKSNPHVADSAGIPYVLQDFQIQKLASGGTMVRYYHETLAPMKAIASGTYPGQTVDLPALDFLEEYGVAYGPTTTIEAMFPPIEEGDPLP